jgi:hypothetical protein
VCVSLSECSLPAGLVRQQSFTLAPSSFGLPEIDSLLLGACVSESSGACAREGLVLAVLSVPLVLLAIVSPVSVSLAAPRSESWFSVSVRRPRLD